MILVIMGPQASGKGTQAELLEEEYDFTHVSVGDVLRREAEKDTERANTIEEYMERGDLIPEDLNDEIIEEIIQKHEDKIILDGYPRDHHQIEHLFDLVDVAAVLYIHISDEEAVDRISQRRICTATQETYIADEITEEDRKRCREAGGEIVHRDDDKPEAVKHRLEIFHEETQPLLEEFEERGVPLLKIDGEQSIEDVHDEIVEKMKQVGLHP